MAPASRPRRTLASTRASSSSGWHGFDARAAAAGRVVTGEGRLDEQSAAGKLVSVVARRARAAGALPYAVVGQAALAPAAAQARIGLADVLEAGTPAQLRAAGERLARQQP